MEAEARLQREQQQLAAKVANFKGGVVSGKTLLERERQCREQRYNSVNTLVSTEGLTDTHADEVRKEFHERERQGLRTKCKRWCADDFEAQKIIGEGAFGTVYLAKNRGTEDFYALKQMRKDHYKRKNTRDRAFAERNILAEGQSKWFVTLHTTFQDADHIFMVMEFLQGGDLIFHLIKKSRFTLEESRFYMAELLEALDTVHQLGFVHRDVKPDNIVLTAEGHLKLLDFGLAKHAWARDEQSPETLASATIASTPESKIAQSGARRRLRSQVGTPQYMAPEVWSGDYGPEADIWSLGIILFECLVGHVPFHAGNVNEGPQMIRIVGEKIRNFEELLPALLGRAKTKGYLTTTSSRFLANVLSPKETRLLAQACRTDPFFFSIDFKGLHSMQPPIIPKIEHAGDTSCFDNFDDPDNAVQLKLPPAPSSGKKDPNMEWCGYEFNRAAQEFQSPVVQATLFETLKSVDDLPLARTTSSESAKGSRVVVPPQFERVN